MPHMEGGHHFSRSIDERGDNESVKLRPSNERPDRCARPDAILRFSVLAAAWQASG
jgi:hypothetical protein